MNWSDCRAAPDKGRSTHSSMHSPNETGLRNRPAPRSFDPADAGDLNRAVARGGAFTLATQAARFGLRIVSIGVLARLLTPEDFGLVAMVTVITGFVEMFKDSGMAMATIQRREITHQQVSTLFWINVGLGVAVMLIEAGLAPAIAWFYGDTRLLDVTLAFAVLTVFGGLSIQHQAILRRRMQFGRLAAIELGSGVSGIVTAVFMARSGWGYWSLVGMTGGSVIGSAVLSFVLSGWRPGLPSRNANVGGMVKFGANLAGANFFGYLIRNADNFVVGYLHGTAALGMYTRGYALFLMPMQQFLTPISSVVIPALSRLTHDPKRFREMFLEKSYLVVFGVVITTGFIFSAAPQIVAIVLGPGWEEVSTIIRCLALGGIISGTNFAGSWVSTTHGWAHRQLRVAVVGGPIYTLSFFAGGLYGPVGVASAYSIVCMILRYPVLRYLCAQSPIEPQDILGPLARIGWPVVLAASLSLLVAVHVELGHVLMDLMLRTGVYLGVLFLMWWAGRLALPKLTLGRGKAVKS